LADELGWVRSWINENYLWYQEVPYTLFNPASFSSPVDYFNVMKSTGITASGKARDQFHFTYPSAQYDALQYQGVELGYGIAWARGPNVLPRVWVISMVEPGSPAHLAGLRRGDQLVSVDDADFARGNDAATLAALNAGLFPKVQGELHRLLVSRDGGTLLAAVKAASISATPVQNVGTIQSANGKVGYLTFNSHNAVSERQLVAAVRQFKAAGIADLVLDLRYNGGGFLAIASEMAYMIAGSAATKGRVFERLQFNDKRHIDNSTSFYATGQGFSSPRSEALPTLDLKRVTVLTSSGTCSASEAIINGLRGIDVEVTLIGGQTCGKPYGFYATPNCGTTYFAVEFQGVNDKGFGDYADGMAPTCSAADDYTHALGDQQEGMLAAALYQRAHQACPMASSGARLAERAHSSALQPVRPVAAEVVVRNRALDR
jgi:membrane-associated protease RseP (regulator of RpoE activity)